MKCAYCNNEMIEGFIPCRGGLTWCPKYKSQTSFIETYLHNKNREEGFSVGKMHWIIEKKRTEKEAWYCPECDVIVIDCKQEE